LPSIPIWRWPGSMTNVSFFPYWYASGIK
jgi:hypothetical protein